MGTVGASEAVTWRGDLIRIANVDCFIPNPVPSLAGRLMPQVPGFFICRFVENERVWE